MEPRGRGGGVALTGELPNMPSLDLLVRALVSLMRFLISGRDGHAPIFADAHLCVFENLINNFFNRRIFFFGGACVAPGLGGGGGLFLRHTAR